MTNSDHINYFAETDYRGKKIKFGIKEGDRARHMYVIGKTGMGKSTLLENLAVQDIQNGEGLCFIDPHGSSAEMLLAYVPKHRVDDVVYFAPFDQEFPVALNVMEDIGHDKRALVASGLIGAFKKVWVDAWSPRMEYILNNALLALLETPDSTLLGVNRMFSDKPFRDSIIANVTDPAVLAFWRDEYAKYSDRFATEATAAIQNKVGQFVANPLIRNIIGQPKSTFDIRKLMDEKKIFIVNLSKGRIGEGNANLIGSMLITKIYLAAMSRAEIHPTELHKFPAFYLYVDEFQSFANESFADILSEARKYKLALTIAHQYIEQMSEEVRAAVFGNVGTMISFRVGSYDAEVLEKEYAPQFTSQDIVSLGFAQVYLKLMINGIGSQPFSATTLPRPVIPEPNFVREVIDRSRAQFGRPRAALEEEIRKWHEPIEGSTEDSFVPKTRKYPPGERPQYPSSGDRPAPSGRPMFRSGTDAGQGDRTQSRTLPVRPQDDRPKKDAPVHQPFASELSRALEEAQGEQKEENESPPAVETEVKRPPEEVREVVPPPRPVAPVAPPQPSIAEIQNALPSAPRPRQPAVPLASLKSPVRKDKGMTPERLSDLKAVLEKALASSGKGKEEGERPAPAPEVRREAREERPRPTPTSEVEPSPRAVIEPRRAVSEPKDVTMASPAPAVRPAPPPDSQPSAPIRSMLPTIATRVSIPVHTPRNDVPPEIPEDILRRVLRVD